MRADLLHAFANRGIFRIFVVIDKSARQAPQAVARLDGAPAQDDAPRLVADGASPPRSLRCVRNVDASFADRPMLLVHLRPQAQVAPATLARKSSARMFAHDSVSS